MRELWCQADAVTMMMVQGREGQEREGSPKVKAGPRRVIEVCH